MKYPVILLIAAGALTITGIGLFFILKRKSRKDTSLRREELNEVKILKDSFKNLSYHYSKALDERFIEELPALQSLSQKIELIPDNHIMSDPKKMDTLKEHLRYFENNLEDINDLGKNFVSKKLLNSINSKASDIINLK